jgi:ankyrin repeat protein
VIRRGALSVAAIRAWTLVAAANLVQLLIELGADPTIEDRSYHATPLGWAEQNNQQEVVDYSPRCSYSPEEERSES